MSLSTTAAVKQTAKTALKGKYFEGVAVSALYIFAYLVCLFCYGVLDSTAGPFPALIFLVCVFVFLIIPLTLGFVYYAVRLIFGSDTAPLLLFKYFSSREDYARALRLALPITGNAIYSGVLLFLPAFILDLISSGTAFRIFGAKIPLWVSGLWGVSAVLKVFAGICLIAVMLKYYLAPFLIAADENMEPLKAMHMSKLLSAASKKDFVWLILSFTWYILACLFMIPNIFIFPYFASSYCVHCRFAVAAYNKNADRINQKDIASFEVI